MFPFVFIFTENNHLNSSFVTYNHTNTYILVNTEFYPSFGINPNDCKHNVAALALACFLLGLGTAGLYSVPLTIT